MVATPRRTDEAPTPAPKHANRQSSTSRRRAKSRVDDSGDSNSGESQPSANKEVSQKVSRTEASEVRGSKTEMVSGEFKVGDLIAYSNALDKPMEIIEIVGDRFQVHRLYDDAKFYVYRSLVVRCTEIVAAELAAILTPEPELKSEAENFNSETNQLSIAVGSTLDLLVAETNNLYGKLEEAEQVACSAAHSALEFARDMGDRLCQLKKMAGHGNWERVREQIKSPRTNRPIPSETATLYQRIFERWNELDTEAIATIREAREALKKPRLNSATVADLQPIIYEKDLVGSLEGLQEDFRERKAAAEARSAEDGFTPDYDSSSISGESFEDDPGLVEVNPSAHPAGILASAKTSQHPTPEWLWKAGLEALGVEAFDLDPASFEGSPIPCKTIYTKEQDGLKQEWKAETLWSNFPYSDDGKKCMHLWINQLIASINSGNVHQALTLVKSDCRPVWFQKLLNESTAYCFLAGAVTFEGNENSSFFGSVVFYFGADVDRFYTAFSRLGTVSQTVNPEMFAGEGSQQYGS